MFNSFKAPAAYNAVQKTAWYAGIIITIVILVTVVALMGYGLIWLWRFILGV